jgi:hypothetical protein
VEETPLMYTQVWLPNSRSIFMCMGSRDVELVSLLRHQADIPQNSLVTML